MGGYILTFTKITAEPIRRNYEDTRWAHGRFIIDASEENRD